MIVGGYIALVEKGNPDFIKVKVDMIVGGYIALVEKGNPDFIKVKVDMIVRAI